MADRIRFAIVGTSKRSDYLYGPLLEKLAEDVELCAVWGRSELGARRLGEKLRVPWFTDLDQMHRQVRPDAAVVSVQTAANGDIGLRMVDLGVHALLETPIAVDLATADAIIRRAAERRVWVEVAEQYYRRPMEQLKGALIKAGIFGRVLVAHNECMGHGYHGVSLIRSYIGFDTPVTSVSAAFATFPVAPHHAWIDRKLGPRDEEWQHAVIRFADSRLGIFEWSSIAYDSSLRWARSTKFFAEKGMAIGDYLTVLTDDGADPRRIEVTRRFHNVGGVETLSALVADTDPEVVWVNPFRAHWMDDECIATAGALASLVRAIRENRPPEYGAEQARLDQEVTLAMEASARRGGEPITLPLLDREGRGKTPRETERGDRDAARNEPGLTRDDPGEGGPPA